ncbi:RNA polymerase sigma-70 factor, ECF subfamily [Rhodococcus maanshanensis]|uniref:RNA polymerase sigma-70 factor, ECF subfamily n=1 Tax=Rhodococcus maanshanensis TaxID=183556 RepID=A0A1H7KI40_9NOCA|nr:RNA polymerase sigma-70 factor, ECF subfamily [Rhodococcus maanshanensis]
MVTGPGSTGSGVAPEHGLGETACPADAGQALARREAESAELAALLTRAADGDSGSFAELYDRTCARVYGMVLRVLRDPGFAEETTQEVYLQLWRTADDFDNTRGSAVSWLMTLAHRRAVDRVRSEQSHSNREVVYESRNRGSEFDEVAEEVSGRLDRQAVIACLDTLTPVQRESVSLAYYGGRTYREVAVQLGVALPTIKTRIRDGLARLRGCLGVA